MNVKVFNNHKELFHFTNWFEGELIFKGNNIYHNGELVAKFIKENR